MRQTVKLIGYGVEAPNQKFKCIYDDLQSAFVSLTAFEEASLYTFALVYVDGAEDTLKSLTFYMKDGGLYCNE